MLMLITTNNPSLRSACPFLGDHSVIYGNRFLGHRGRFDPSGYTNMIDQFTGLAGRTLIDLEFKNKPETNADGYGECRYGEWSFDLADSRANPDRRFEDVFDFHRGMYELAHRVSPGIKVGWWMMPKDDGAAYAAYRDLVFTGQSSEVDRLRDITARVAAEVELHGPIMDYAAVVHYIHSDELGEGKGRYNDADGITWARRAEILAAKVETAKAFDLPVLVYVYAKDLDADGVQAYINPIIEHGGVSECVVWFPPSVTFGPDDETVKGLNEVQKARLQ